MTPLKQVPGHHVPHPEPHSSDDSQVCGGVHLRSQHRQSPLPVDIIFNAQQVVRHGLQRQLMQERRHRVKATVQNQQLGARLVWTLHTSELRSEREHLDLNMSCWHLDEVRT